MSLNPQIDKHPNGDLWLVWDADPKAECYRMIAPDGSVHQVGKKQTAVRLGKPAQPFTVSLAPAYAIPSMVETITYPDVSPPPSSTVPRCGISVGGEMLWRSISDRSQAVNLIAQAGAKVVRFDLARGSEAAVDSFVSQVQIRGMEPLLILGGWLGVPPTYDWRAFVAASRDRYVAKGVRLFETSNEPNIVNYPADVYAQNTIVAYEEMHRNGDDVMLAVGALSLPAVNLLSYAKLMFTNGVGGHFDAFSVHAYNRATEHGTWSAWDATFGHPSSYPPGNNIVDVMRLNGGVKPVWITECGDNATKIGDQYQADAVREALADPRPQLSTVYTIDDRDVPGFGIYGRPAYDAFRAAAA